MIALLVYLHFTIALCLMIGDSTIALMFNRKYRLLKSFVKRTLWPLYAVIYVLLVWQATNGSERAKKAIHWMR